MTLTCVLYIYCYQCIHYKREIESIAAAAETLVVLYIMFCYNIFINIYVVRSPYAMLTVIYNGSRYVAMFEELITCFSDSMLFILRKKVDFIKRAVP